MRVVTFIVSSVLIYTGLIILFYTLYTMRRDPDEEEEWVI